MDQGEELGLHGRISHLQAEEVQATTCWEGDVSKISVSGKVRETRLHAENLVLERRIEARGGDRGFQIGDTVTNEGFTTTPFMLLYHINLGFPLVDKDSRFLAPILSTEAWEETPEAVRSIDRCCELEAPSPEREDAVFFHDLGTDTRGDTCIAVVNKKLRVGLQIGYNKNELPYLSQAKIMKPQDYFLALEPGNCTPEGRVL